MKRTNERLKELLILSECYRKMIKRNQITEEELRAALEIVKEELEEIKGDK